LFLLFLFFSTPVQLQPNLALPPVFFLSSFNVWLLLIDHVVVDVLQLRRERIAERMKALQELVPNANKVSNQRSAGD
jgi:hypothetical protein